MGIHTIVISGQLVIALAVPPLPSPEMAAQSAEKKTSKPDPPKPKRPKKRKQPSSGQIAEEFIISTLEKGIEGLRREFNRNPRIYDTAKCTDIGCHDHNRVHVVGANPDEYIHANYVGIEKNPKCFICTQGPMEATCADFWMMVIQQKAWSILMLGEFEEQNRPRCAKYYPDKLGQQLTFQTRDRGPIVVTNSGEEEDMGGRRSTDEMVLFIRPGHAAQVHIRHMTVRGLDSEYEVTHYHVAARFRWVNWPDRGAPPPNQDPFNLLYDMCCGSDSSPIVLHCSAGVGRAGALVLMRAVLEKELRQCRAGLVQTPHQYYYVHAALLKFLSDTICKRDRMIKLRPKAMPFWADYKKEIDKVNDANNKSTMSYLPSLEKEKQI
ncbi:unnamed protein product, partial [Mesorhabditis spiculigera]